MSLRLALAFVTSIAVGSARAASDDEARRRRQLIDILGIGDAQPAAPKEEPAPAAPPPTGEPPVRASPRASAAPSTYVGVARPALAKSCASCHAASGLAGKTRLSLGDDPAAELVRLGPLVDRAAPERSALLTKGLGQQHGGGEVWKISAQGYRDVLRWISDGAHLDAKPTAIAPPLVPATPPPADVQPQAAPALVPSTDVAPATAASERALPATLHDALLAACGSCHGDGGMAASTRYRAHPDRSQHAAELAGALTAGQGATSLVTSKASGQQHAGGAPFAPGGPELGALIAWIDGLAGAAEQSAPPSPPQQAPPQAASGVAPHERPGDQGRGLHLLEHFYLNGRFDLAYERRGHEGDPFAGGDDVLRSYHHFLFLTRSAADDPFGVSIELLTQQFYEVSYERQVGAWSIGGKLGKILVPFGAEPLFHQAYGGLVGFDQRVVPTVWAQEGAAAKVKRRVGPLQLSDDLFAVRGYRLRRGDAVLNLQNDFSPLDDARLGLGNRLGASWGSLSLYYSAYANDLDFGRWLFLQALDLTLWRPRQLPVVRYFSAAAGLLRADVSGGEAQGFGGPGKDYFHFASYAQLRYHPTDWLYVQYRQGLRTFGNRRGVIADDTRFDSTDGSTHSLAAQVRYDGLSAMLMHAWNLEKADEVRDDFLRFVVTYEF